MNPTEGTINVVDEKSKKTVALLNSGISPTNLIHSKVGDKLYVTSLTEPINILNVSKELIDEMKMNSSNDDLPGIELKDTPSTMAIAPENERLYVTYLNKKEISVVDISKDQLTESISLNFSPNNIALNPQTNFLYMTSNDTVYVLDTLTNHLLNVSLSLNHTINNLAVDAINNLFYLHAPGTNLSDPGINSVFRLENNRFHQENSYSGDKVLHPFPLLSVSNPVWGENILSHILPHGTTNVTFSTGFDPVQDLDYDDSKDLAYILTDWNLYEVDFVTEMAKNITRMDSIFVSDMLFDSEKDVIYISDSLRNVVQVIDASSGEKINEIKVGNSPTTMVLNPDNGILYVLNTESKLISVINSSSYKPLVPSIIFNINPPNAGYVQCNNGGIVTNQYIRMSNDENCEAKSNEGFAFSNWVENFGKNSTKIISSVSKKDSWYAPFENLIRYVADKFKIETSTDAASAFTISHNGNFTANFEKIPPPLPPEYWTTLTTFVLTTIVGAYFIPSFIGFMRTRSKVSKQNNFHKEIQSIYDDGKLDNNDIDKLDNLKTKITDSFSAGKISVEQYDNLNNQISISYDEIFNKKINSIEDDKEFSEKLKPIEEEITKAYSKKKLLELQYKLLKEKIKQLRGDNSDGSE